MILSGWRGCKAVSLLPSGQLSFLRDKPCWGLDGFLLLAGWVVEVEEGLAGVCDSIREPQSWFQGGRQGKLAQSFSPHLLPLLWWLISGEHCG